MNQILNFVILGFIGPQELIIILLILSLVIIPIVVIQNTLKEISYYNRKMQPGQVWLMLIPIFGLIWAFVIVNRVADSIKAEFASKNIKINEERPGFNIGLAACILYCCSIIPILRFLALVGFVCWIIYLVKINNYKIKLKQTYSNANLKSAEEQTANNTESEEDKSKKN